MSQKDKDKDTLIQEIKKITLNLLKKRELDEDIYNADREYMLRDIQKKEEALTHLFIGNLIDEVDNQDKLSIEDIYILQIFNNFLTEAQIQLSKDSIVFDNATINKLLIKNHFEPISYLLREINKNQDTEKILSEISNIFLSEDLLNLNMYNIKDV